MTKPKPKRAASVSKPRKGASTAVSKSKPLPAKKEAPRKSPVETADWREETLARMRTLITEAVPNMTEERKWKKPSNGMEGVPVWSSDGIVCTGETYKKVVKLTFARGASLSDPSGLFNASLEGGTRRAIDIPEGGKVDAAAFKTLVKAAAAENAAARLAACRSRRRIEQRSVNSR